jgi:hypothetical protein
MPAPDTRTAWSLDVIVAVLRACHLVALLSLLFTGAALSPWMSAAPGLLRSMIVMLGLGTIWYGVRIIIDERLFRRLLVMGPRDELDTLDQALMDLSMMKPDKAGRPMHARMQGALRLVRRQAGLTLAQGIVTVLALLS